MKLPSFGSHSHQPSHFLACHIEESFATLAVWGMVEGKVQIVQVATPKEWQDSDTLKDAFEMGMEELHEHTEDVKDVLFGLPEEWVGESDIKNEYKEILKALTQKFSLTPLGFVVAQEALCQHLSRQPTTSPQFLLFEFTPTTLQLAVVQKGVRVQNESIGRSDDLISDLQEGLARLQARPYPTQLFFFSLPIPQEKLEEEKQLFLSHDWQASEIFLHLPEVTVITRAVLMEAICVTGGGEVVKSLTTAVPRPPAHSVHNAEEESSDVVEMTEEDKNIVSEDEPPVRRRIVAPKKIVMIPLILCVLSVIAYGVMFFTLSVQIDVYLEPKPVSADVTITLDPKLEATQAEQNMLKASVQTLELKERQELSTTGTKIIGEKAIGTVTLINKTESEKGFSKGTQLSMNSKIFLLDEDVVVASATSKETNDGKTLEFGKKDAKVTAKEIGAEYNLAKESEFTLANFSKDTYSARNAAEFSGGSSREIQAVAKADQQKLSESLLSDLRRKAEQEVKSVGGEGVYSVLTGKTTVAAEQFNAKVGDEVNTLTLEMTVKYEYVTYQASDLLPIAKANLAKQVPEGARLLEDTVSILSKSSESSTQSAQLTLAAQLSAEYTPRQDTAAWRAQTAGKTIEQAARYLENLEEIASVRIAYSPSISALIFPRIPSSEQRVHVQVHERPE